VNTQGEFDFQVRSYECGADGTATLPTICNYLQEVASLHAKMLGFSRSDFEKVGENTSWILTRLRVKMTRYPKWEDTVRVTTYPRKGRRITAERDFILSVGDERIGIATSEWMIINLATRKIVPIPQFVYDIANDEMPPVLGADAFSKLRWDCRETTGAARFTARRGDIDLNGHVNNVHYIEWLVEALPEGAGKITDFEITFKSETLAGDEIVAEAVEVEPGVFAAHGAAPDGKDHVVARLVTK